MAVVMTAVFVYSLMPGSVEIGPLVFQKVNLPFINKPKPAVRHIVHCRPKLRHHTFLFFGDSMVEGLAKRLADYTGENNHRLYTVIWYSSTTERWASTRTLEYFIHQYKPTYIILCLGSNELFVNDLDTRAEYIATLVGKMNRLPYVWIGPADWNGNTGIVNLIAKGAGRGHFFDSRHMNLQRGTDHYHPTWLASAQWMDSVVRFMSSHEAADPVQLHYPKAHHKAAVTKLLIPNFKGY